MGQITRRVTVAFAFAGMLLAAPAVGAPGDRTTHLITPGTTNAGVTFEGASTDGSRVWFETTEALTAADTDIARDVYERGADGSLRLISGGTVDAVFVGATPDGSRVWFRTTAKLDPGDVDVALDVYERAADGTLRLVSPGTADADASFRDATADGSRVWFHTLESLTAADTDFTQDVYERGADGSLRLISGGTADADASLQDATADGTRVWFRTAEALLAGDADAAFDLYERAADGSLRLISGGTAGASAFFEGASADGSRVWFHTAEALAAGDTDTAEDVYERAADGTLRLISPGSASTLASFESAADDGSRVWFGTAESLAAADTDTADDVYERAADGSLRLISPGTGSAGAFFHAAAADGSRVWFRTLESLTPADADTARDVYERGADGSLRLVSPGTANVDAIQVGASRDGSRVWFRTTEALTGDDTDLTSDTFERGADGSLRLVSPGSAATFARAGSDGSRILFVTEQAILPDDVDVVSDVYEVRWGVPVLGGVPVVSGVGRVGSVLSCSDGGPVGEGVAVSRSWRRDGVPIDGATGGTYTPVTADAGRLIACRVTAANPIGAAQADSAPVRVGPLVTRRAVVGGFPLLGARVVCQAGVAGAAGRSVVWRRAGRIVGRAATYRIGRADVGRRITCTLTATAPGAGAVSSTSPARLIPARCRVVRVRGLTPAAARTRLGNAGCRSRVVRSPGSGVARGRVLGTVPATGATRPNGATITIRTRG